MSFLRSCLKEPLFCMLLELARASTTQEGKKEEEENSKSGNRDCLVVQATFSLMLRWRRKLVIWRGTQHPRWEQSHQNPTLAFSVHYGPASCFLVSLSPVFDIMSCCSGNTSQQNNLRWEVTFAKEVMSYRGPYTFGIALNLRGWGDSVVSCQGFFHRPSSCLHLTARMAGCF